MINRKKEVIKPVITKNGTERMVARLIFLEPSLWTMYDRLAKIALVSRSTFIRRELKKARPVKIDNVGRM